MYTLRTYHAASGLTAYYYAIGATAMDNMLSKIGGWRVTKQQYRSNLRRGGCERF